VYTSERDPIIVQAAIRVDSRRQVVVTHFRLTTVFWSDANQSTKLIHYLIV